MVGVIRPDMEVYWGDYVSGQTVPSQWADDVNAGIDDAILKSNDIGSITVDFTASDTITRTAGGSTSFLTDGAKVGDFIKITNAVDTVNNDIFEIATVSATVITTVESTIVAEIGDVVTIVLLQKVSGFRADQLNIDSIVGDIPNSPDDDLYAIFGRAFIGYNGTDSDKASFGHRDNRNDTDYAVRQDETGATIINAKATQGITFRVNDVVEASLTATAFDIATNAFSGSGFSFSGAELVYLDSIATANAGLNALTSGEVDQLETIGATVITLTDWQRMTAVDQGLTTTSDVRFGEVEIGGAAQSSSNVLYAIGADGHNLPLNAIVLIDETGTDKVSNFLMTLKLSGVATPDTADHWISFIDNSDNVEGEIHSGVVYAAFTGSHDGQLERSKYLSEEEEFYELENWDQGMIVISTGVLDNGYKSNIARALPQIELSSKSKQKSVMGIYSDFLYPGHKHSGIDNDRHCIYYNALGEGRVLITDSNGEPSLGDYIQTSNHGGIGEKQDDDLLHSYTVCKITETIDWSKVNIDSLLGIKIYLAGCTYHCG